MGNGLKMTNKVPNISLYLLTGKKFFWSIFKVKTKETFSTFLKTSIRDTPMLVAFAIHRKKWLGFQKTHGL